MSDIRCFYGKTFKTIDAISLARFIWLNNGDCCIIGGSMLARFVKGVLRWPYGLLGAWLSEGSLLSLFTCGTLQQMLFYDTLYSGHSPGTVNVAVVMRVWPILMGRFYIEKKVSILQKNVFLTKAWLLLLCCTQFQCCVLASGHSSPNGPVQ